MRINSNTAYGTRFLIKEVRFRDLITTGRFIADLNLIIHTKGLFPCSSHITSQKSDPISLVLIFSYFLLIKKLDRAVIYHMHTL